ncbi:MAG: voltage-gated potassium channel protein [Proteobacteria bacterium]|nr:voltage-gated potassium channel protein [Pseudomonadota bacterium]MDE3208108.1 voltage-gated potassium channel protein [Pseudomonadota bacterium]
MNLFRAETVHRAVRRIYRHLKMALWFPHGPLALLVLISGFILLRNELGADWSTDLYELVYGARYLQPIRLPAILISGGMFIMAPGLLFRSRTAWIMTLLLLLSSCITYFFIQPAHEYRSLAFFAFLLLALLLSWKQFSRSSIAASWLFTAASALMLILFATFGSYYLGSGYNPPITNLLTAFYYSMVTMSTVGYGDITPKSQDAMLFTVSIIILGITVFATSLTAVIVPLVNQNLQRLLNHKGQRMKRENHFIVIGRTPLAINTWRELTKRDCPVTLITREAMETHEFDGADLIVGDPSDENVLRQAGADKATAILAMLTDDSENAFVILAAKEVGGQAKTIAAVNDGRHLKRLKLVQPDVIIAPQVLGGELLAMILSGEEITPDFVMQRLLHQDN